MDEFAPILDEMREYLMVDGGLPERAEVVDVTPAGHATRRYGVRLDYGWCEELVECGYLRYANFLASAIIRELGIPGSLMQGTPETVGG